MEGNATQIFIHTVILCAYVVILNTDEKNERFDDCFLFWSLCNVQECCFMLALDSFPNKCMNGKKAFCKCKRQHLCLSKRVILENTDEFLATLS